MQCLSTSEAGHEPKLVGLLGTVVNNKNEDSQQQRRQQLQHVREEYEKVDWLM